MSIIDTIKYEGVQYGMTHTIKTYLVDKSTGKTVKDDNGNDIVKTTEWEPEATQGSIDIEIPVTGKKLAGRTLVVFEEIYLGDAMIACHKDINDANQTIKVKGYRDCTVIKRIKADDYWKEHGDPTFIFKLTGTDTLGASHTYYQSVTFTESYKNPHAWVLADVKPVEDVWYYDHPNGAVIWVKDVSPLDEMQDERLRYGY